MPADFRVSITDAPGAQSYPISSFTWLLVYKRQSNHAKGEAIVNLLKWALIDGQKDATALNYAPLPQAIVRKELEALKEINTGDLITTATPIELRAKINPVAIVIERRIVGWCVHQFTCTWILGADGSLYGRRELIQRRGRRRKLSPTSVRPCQGGQA
ncbi:MAG: hypothetical protein JO166_01940 [Deltaproteobacteria bacterium]|nr:hypothetical protein [Deltaproteobacteria bacterium]